MQASQTLMPNFCTNILQATEELQLPPLSIRAASSSEPTPDLQQPAFAADRLPLLLYPTWQENYSECQTVCQQCAYACG